SASFVGRRPALRHADLLPLAERNRRTDIVLYTGESDVIDVYSAHRLRRAPRVRLLSVRGYGHEVARFFHEQGLLPPLLDAALHGEAPLAEFPQRGSLLEHDDAVALLFEGHQAHRHGDAAAAEAALERCI